MTTLSYSYDRREASRTDGLEVDYQVKKYSDEVIVTLIVTNREEWYTSNGYRRGLPSEMKKPNYSDGKLYLDLVSLESLSGVCRDNALSLHEKVFHRGEPKVWKVKGSIMHPKLQGRGLGKEMYLRAFKAISPAIVTSDECGGGSTSYMAERVWKSLASKYPHEGSGKDIVLAVR